MAEVVAQSTGTKRHWLAEALTGATEGFKEGLAAGEQIKASRRADRALDIQEQTAATDTAYKQATLQMKGQDLLIKSLAERRKGDESIARQIQKDEDQQIAIDKLAAWKQQWGERNRLTMQRNDNEARRINNAIIVATRDLDQKVGKEASNILLKSISEARGIMSEVMLGGDQQALMMDNLGKTTEEALIAAGVPPDRVKQLSKTVQESLRSIADIEMQSKQPVTESSMGTILNSVLDLFGGFGASGDSSTGAAGPTQPKESAGPTTTQTVEALSGKSAASTTEAAAEPPKPLEAADLEGLITQVAGAPIDVANNPEIMRWIDDINSGTYSNEDEMVTALLEILDGIRNSTY